MSTVKRTVFDTYMTYGKFTLVNNAIVDVYKIGQLGVIILLQDPKYKSIVYLGKYAPDVAIILYACSLRLNLSPFYKFHIFRSNL